jgi:uncharacterized membrane protein
VSASTGRPTVLGWVGHQRQWRGGDEAAWEALQPRQADVNTIYSTTDLDLARDLLEQYNIRYIYVGQLERDAYAAASLAKFAQIATPVFSSERVVIYRYDN